MQILKLIDSLRSGLAKNAMITLNEFSEILKKQLDPEIDQIILKLFKRC